MRLMFPDLLPPPVIGFNHNTQTVPHRLSWEFAAPWGTTTANVANSFPTNELFLVLLNRHPNCVMIYNEWTNGTETHELIASGASRPLLRNDEWINFSQITESATSATGVAISPSFDPPEGLAEGSYIWIDSNASATNVLNITYPGNSFLANTTYYMGYVRRIGNAMYFAVLSVTTGGAATNSVTFTLPATSSGYYCFIPMGSFPEAIPTALNIVTNRGGVSSYAIRHSFLPSGLCDQMESIRVNACRVIMTNFSGPFNAEGGAVACELPSFKRWDEVCFNNGSNTSSPFSVLANLEGKKVIDNAEGISAFGHADITADPRDPLQIGNNFIAGGTYSSPSLDDLGGGTYIIMRTALANTAARDGWWQVYWATESETDSQLWTRQDPEYTPTTILNAQQAFKKVSVITHNPNHFREGVNALRNLAGTGERMGDVLISTGVGAAVGAPLKFASGFWNKMLGAI
jgi:hypothetical protein